MVGLANAAIMTAQATTSTPYVAAALNSLAWMSTQRHPTIFGTFLLTAQKSRFSDTHKDAFTSSVYMVNGSRTSVKMVGMVFLA